MPTEHAEENRRLILEISAAEAAGLYQILVGSATAFLAGTLIFVEKIAPNPSGYEITLLGLGWLSLVLCISTVALIRLANIDCATACLGGGGDATTHQNAASRYTKLGVGLLCAGMVFVSLAGFVSLVRKDFMSDHNNERPIVTNPDHGPCPPCTGDGRGPRADFRGGPPGHIPIKDFGKPIDVPTTPSAPPDATPSKPQGE
jgi:hypothetical protein